MNVLGHIDDLENPYELNIDQQLILKSLSDNPPDDLNYLQEWVARIDFDALNYETLKMIPALYQHFRHHDLSIPYLPRMKGIYRYFSLKNNLVFSNGLSVLKAMIAADIPVLLFKGAALTVAYYKNLAVRPMNDMDFIIQKKHLPRVENILKAQGFHYRYPEKDKSDYLHSYDYINAHQQGIDIHWYALYENTLPGIDEGLWQRARSCTWEGLKVTVLSPEDLILTSMVNGFRDLSFVGPDKTDEIQWVYDVLTIIKSEKNIQWELVFQEAEHRGLTNIILYAMLLIHKLSPAFISAEVMSTLFLANEKFYKNLLSTLVLEGRAHFIKNETLQALNIPHTAITYNRYIRYRLSKENTLESLQMPRSFAPFLMEIFTVKKERAFESRLAQKLNENKNAYVEIQAAELAFKKNTKLDRYKAHIDILNSPLKSHYLAGDILILDLCILQQSKQCWVLDSESRKKIGVSYHLLSSQGKIITWDFSRSYLFAPKKNYINFIPPQTKIYTQLRIKLPEQPGHYQLALDIVQEEVIWFSQKNNAFPRLMIQVTPNEQAIVLTQSPMEVS